MKTELTLTVDANVVALAETYARSRGISVSSLVEGLLRELVGDDATTFTARWSGRFQPAGGDDPRYGRLARKYL